MALRARHRGRTIAGRARGGRTAGAAVVAACAVLLLLVPSCGGDAPDESPPSEDPRAGFGNMGLDPRSPEAAELLGPDSFPCGPAASSLGYTRYGVGPQRRGGWEREELEPDHIVLAGKGVNFHGRARVDDGGTIEMEMDEDYFEPSVLRGPPGATVTIELRNEGTRTHTFTVPSQGIDLHCGVRAVDAVSVTFPRSGILEFVCRFGSTSGMRGALLVS